MPHEHIYSEDADPNTPNRVQVAWGGPSSPSNTGPGHGNGDGHVMIIVERPGTPARMAASVEETQRRLTDIVAEALPASARAEADSVVANLLATAGEDLSYAFGGQCELLAVMIDRKGCNNLISAVRRGRDAAFGKDQ